MANDDSKRGFLSWLFRRGPQAAASQGTQTFGTMDHEMVRRAFSESLSSAGKAVSDDTSMGVSAAWACRRILTETIGSIPWSLYRKDAKGNATRADDHYLQEVLCGSPNADQTPVEFKECSVMGLTGPGNMYSYIDRIGKRVTALTPIETTVRPMRQGAGTRASFALRDGEVFFRIDDRGKTDDLPRERVWQLKGFGRGRLQGLSPIGAAREAMGGAMASQDFANKFFQQGGFPAGIVSVPNWLNPEHREIARENLQQMIAGLGNAHRFALFEGGMKPEPWEPMNLEDMQFILVRKFSVLEVCRFFRVPPHMVAELEKGASYASIEQMSQDFVMFTLLPYFTRFEASVSKWLLTPEDRAKGVFLRFNFEGLLRADSKSRAEFYASALQNGWMDRNEVRAKENLNHDPRLDGFTMQTNLAPAEKVLSGEALERQRQQPQPREPQEPRREEQRGSTNVSAAVLLPDSMHHEVQHHVPVAEAIRDLLGQTGDALRGVEDGQQAAAEALRLVAEGQADAAREVVRQLGEQIASQGAHQDEQRRRMEVILLRLADSLDSNAQQRAEAQELARRLLEMK